ncbi:CppA N-terminal domain-containing protein [Streptococcus oricebi]|uniref:Proteinase n=1 Tax=Streptococcus oricebi TaxID=1547447 RepID=A0ABS5B4L5_9STRE|nr:CppA N-terminal domain-containing protein [Streptococcus oricebi]MBP2623745.1 proteinase [Streptococcus oricebi]
MGKKNQMIQTIPVVRVNNRNRNLKFYLESLGMKNLLEEGATASLGDQTKTERLLLEEVPSTRARKVEGTKKLGRIIFRVAEASEVESLLADLAGDYELYQGPKGYAFSLQSPEGDTFLLHAEASYLDLKPLSERPSFKKAADFQGLSQFELEKIEICVPQVQESQSFYQKLLGTTDLLDFKEAQGADLTTSDFVWDLSMLKFQLADFEVADLAVRLKPDQYFLPKSKKFFLVADPSQIELWFEAL